MSTLLSYGSIIASLSTGVSLSVTVYTLSSHKGLYCLLPAQLPLPLPLYGRLVYLLCVLADCGASGHLSTQ